MSDKKNHRLGLSLAFGRHTEFSFTDWDWSRWDTTYEETVYGASRHVTVSAIISIMIPWGSTQSIQRLECWPASRADCRACGGWEERTNGKWLRESFLDRILERAALKIHWLSKAIGVAEGSLEDSIEGTAP